MTERTQAASKRSDQTSDRSISQKRQQTTPRSFDFPFDHVMFLQRTLGNQTVQSLFNQGLIQPKLKIGKPNDKYEQEAGRIANQVMNTGVRSQGSEAGRNNDHVQKNPG